MGMRLSPEMQAKCLELAGEGQKPLADTISEKDFMAAVIALAKQHGWRVYHTTDSRKSAAGFPDLVMVRRGRLIFAELKTNKGVMSADQLNWINDLNQCLGTCGGLDVVLWHPCDWAKIERVLSAP